jgi:hypothetical protein
VPLLVHGIIEASASPDAPASSASAEVEGTSAVRYEAVTAVVTTTDASEVLPSRGNLLGHTRVLEQLAKETTVLPMRFGMVAQDETDLIERYLAPQQAALVAALERLRGHVELRLRGRYDEDEVLRAVAAADPGIARLQGSASVDARLRLGERIVAGIEVRRERDLERLTDALGPYVAGVVAGSVAEPLDAFSLSLLVPEDGMDAFDRALDELGRTVAPVLALELVGPVPPFSFTAPEGVTA